MGLFAQGFRLLAAASKSLDDQPCGCCTALPAFAGMTRGLVVAPGTFWIFFFD